MRRTSITWIVDRLPIAAPRRLSLAKTATYAVMHLVVAMAVAYALSGSWALALGIGLIEPAVQTVAYTLHERAWRRAAERGASSANAARPVRDALRSVAA
ncbi:MAG: DUF2061 domain-containing protein [Alphaproteobacteria bacterium]|nr:DUF2061 domain-containing protein [Alphaproteobacteria bacterium]